MNTEINLLELKQKKYTIPLMFGAIFLALLIIVVTILFVQKNDYTSKLEVEKNKLEQMEAELLSYQQVMVSEQRWKQLLEKIQSIQEQRLPVVALQEDMMSILPSQSNMVTYLFSGGNTLEIEVSFQTIDDASHYVTQMKEKPYTVDVDLTYLNQIESYYQANFIISLHTQNLIEELGKRE